MAIKIIKNGKLQKFTKTCPDCDCEFEYDLTDLQTDYSICLTTYPGQYNTYVVCPCCGKHIHHGTRFADEVPNSFPKIWYTPTDYTLENNLYDCDKCPNKPDPNKIVVGDTPCTWCKKNQPYCTNAGNTASTGSKLDTSDFTTTVNDSYISPEYSNIELETVDTNIDTNYTTDIK